jgi:hypothetical protein
MHERDESVCFSNSTQHTATQPHSHTATQPHSMTISSSPPLSSHLVYRVHALANVRHKTSHRAAQLHSLDRQCRLLLPLQLCRRPLLPHPPRRPRNDLPRDIHTRLRLDPGGSFVETAQMFVSLSLRDGHRLGRLLPEQPIQVDDYGLSLYLRIVNGF